MPNIPIDLSSHPEFTSTLGAGGGPGPENTGRLQELDRVKQRIEQEILAATFLLDGTRDLQAGTRDPGATGPQFFEQFREKNEQRKDQALAAAPEGMRAVLREDLTVLGAAINDRSVLLEGTSRAVQRRVRLRTLFERYGDIVRNDPTQLTAIASRATAVFDDMNLPEDRRANIRREVHDLIGNAALDGLIDDPVDAQAMLESGAFDALLTPESLTTRRAQVNGEVQRAQVIAKERAMIELSDAADAGGLTETTIGAAVQAGQLTALEANLLRAKNEDALASAAREQALLERIPAKNGRFDPGVPEDQETVDALWKTVGAEISAGKPEEQASRELTFVRNRGVLPMALRNKYVGLLYSADPALQVAGAKAFGALEKINPRLVENFPPEVRDRARAIGEFADIPLAPDLMVSLAEDSLAKTNQDEIPEEFPEETDETAPPENAPEIRPPVEADDRLTAPAKSPAVTTPIRTSKQFVGLLEETFGQPDEIVDQRARESGFAPDLVRIALSLVSASGASEAGRAEILERARKEIAALPDDRGIPKEQLRKLVDDLGPVLGDRNKTLQAIAANRDAFRDRFQQNRDPGGQFRRLAATFALNSAFEARLFADFSKAEGGLDPTDPRNEIGEELPIESGAERPIRLPRVAFFRKGNDKAFMTVPHSVATALMKEPAANQEKFEFIEKWFSGAFTTGELDDQAKALLGRGDALDAFVAADQALQAGKNQTFVLALILPTFFPKLSGESNIFLDILFEMLPGIGQIVAVKQGVKDFDAMAAAIKKGDFDDAALAGLGSALELAALVPGIGPLVRIFKNSVVNVSRNPRVARWLRDTEGVKKLHSGFAIGRAQELTSTTDVARLRVISRSATAEEVFAPAWPTLNPSQQDTLRALLSNINGAAGEAEILKLLQNGDFTTQITKAAKTFDTEDGGRIFDIVTGEGFRRILNTFVLPQRGGRGTLIEVKTNAAIESDLQIRKNAHLENKIFDEGSVTPKNAPTENQVEFEAIQLLRMPVFKIPEDLFVTTVRSVVAENVKKGGTELKHLTKRDIDNIVEAARSWHQSAGNELTNPVDVLTVVTSIGMFAAATEANRLRMAQKREFNRRTGRDVAESLNQPLGS